MLASCARWCALGRAPPGRARRVLGTHPWRPPASQGVTRSLTALARAATHRGARQDQERPQFLSEAGPAQAARPAALGVGLQASGPGPGLLGRLHVPAARPECGGGSGRRRAHSSSQARPARPPRARWARWARRQPLRDRGDPCTSARVPAALAKAHGLPDLGDKARKRSGTNRELRSELSEPQTPGLCPGQALGRGAEGLKPSARSHPDLWPRPWGDRLRHSLSTGSETEFGTCFSVSPLSPRCSLKNVESAGKFRKQFEAFHLRRELELLSATWRLHY